MITKIQSSAQLKIRKAPEYKEYTFKEWSISNVDGNIFFLFSKYLVSKLDLFDRYFLDFFFKVIDFDLLSDVVKSFILAKTNLKTFR